MLNASKVRGKAAGPRKHPDLPPGTYPARVVQLIDFGLQIQRPFKGQEKPPANEIGVTYEFVDEFLLDEVGKENHEKPRWQSETFPLFNIQIERAKSTNRYVALDPEMKHKGDWSKLLGTPCMVTLVHNENKNEPERPYVTVASVTSMRPKEAAKCPELVNPAKFFDLDSPDVDVFNTFPDWVKEKIKENLEYTGSKLERLLTKPGYRSSKEDGVKFPEPELEEDLPW